MFGTVPEEWVPTPASASRRSLTRACDKLASRVRLACTPLHAKIRHASTSRRPHPPSPVRHDTLQHERRTLRHMTPAQADGLGLTDARRGKFCRAPKFALTLLPASSRALTPGDNGSDFCRAPKIRPIVLCRQSADLSRRFSFLG